MIFRKWYIVVFLIYNLYKYIFIQIIIFVIIMFRFEINLSDGSFRHIGKYSDILCLTTRRHVFLVHAKKLNLNIYWTRHVDWHLVKSPDFFCILFAFMAYLTTIKYKPIKTYTIIAIPEIFSFNNKSFTELQKGDVVTVHVRGSSQKTCYLILRSTV